ncbi:MAG: hypothetical protein KatS3mg104_1671 [Phycisphaerae bacterium]|jgi:hypothetical protein|nr:MAG: hypothetical protein KatS3mg104_1671 [Phycisphaerae bacterium]
MTFLGIIGLFGSMILSACAETPSTTQPVPAVVLESGKLSVLVYLPDPQNGHYRGTRFDWSGMINKAQFDSMTFWDEWNPSDDPTGDHDNATGPVLEFGMKSPLGFEEAKPLEGFIKIGVGVLQKPDDGQPYFFRRPYRILDTGDWSVTVSEDRKQVSFRQKLQYHGWGYEYSKTVRLDAQKLLIGCRLENIGQNPIVTDVYNHNFLRPDSRGFEPPIRIEFDRPIRFDDKARIPDSIEINQSSDTLRVTKSTTNSVWFPISINSSDPAKSFTLRKGKLQLTVSHDFTPAKYVFFAIPEVISVEPFLDIDLPPGRTLTWTYQYLFRTDAEGYQTRSDYK